MTWEVWLSLGPKSRPVKRVLHVAPLPSGLVDGQVLMAVRAPSATLQLRLSKLLVKHGPKRRWVLYTHLEAAGARWWVIGPLPYRGGLYYAVVDAIVTRGMMREIRATRLTGKRHLRVIDVVTGDDRDLWPRSTGPTVHAPDLVDDGELALDLHSEVA